MSVAEDYLRHKPAGSRSSAPSSSPTSPTMTPPDLHELVQRQVPWANKQVQVLGEYGPNWDGYGAAAPNPDAVIEAEVFLANMKAFFGVPEPHIVPIRDGGVGIEWFCNGKSLDLEIEPSGSVLFFYKDSQSNVRRNGPVFADSNNLTDKFMWAAKLMFL